MILSPDIDECDMDMDGCSDQCINTEGSFYCLCINTGYEIGDDGRTCVGKEVPHM